MGAKPKTAASSPATRKIARLLLQQPYRSFVLTGLVVVLSIGGAVYAWQRWGNAATPSSDYVVTPEQITVTPQPAWIQADVKADVVRTANLARLDLRDRKLVDNVAAAFALHPWVAHVERVEKRFPPAVEVTLQYRQPVAVVEIAARGESGLLFVDADSVLLPSADFTPEQAKGYLRIVGGQDTPTGMYGMPWGHEGIAGAARVAAAWGDRWQALLLYRIVPRALPDGAWQYELETKEGTRVVWGAAPGREAAGEASPAQKVAALEEHAAARGTLDAEGVGRLDLRERRSENSPRAGQ